MKAIVESLREGVRVFNLLCCDFVSSIYFVLK